MRNYFLGLIILLGVFFSTFTSYAQRKGGYVKSYVTRSGKYVSGHYRKSVSTSPRAYKSRAASRSYYHSKGKYTRRKKH